MFEEITIVLCVRSVRNRSDMFEQQQKQYFRLIIAQRKKRSNSNLEHYENLPCQNLAVDLSQQPLDSGSAIIQ